MRSSTLEYGELTYSNTPTYGESINANNLLSAGHNNGSKAYSNNVKYPLFPPPLYIPCKKGKQQPALLLPFVLKYRRANGRNRFRVIWGRPSNPLDLIKLLSSYITSLLSSLIEYAWSAVRSLSIRSYIINKGLEKSPLMLNSSLVIY